MDYASLERFILKKLRDFERDNTEYESPVRRILKDQDLERDILTPERVFELFSWIVEYMWTRAFEASRAICEFLTANGVSDVPNEPHELGDFLNENLGKFDDLDWTKLRLQIRPSSAIELYSEMRFLRGIIPDDIEAQFVSVAGVYYSAFGEGLPAGAAQQAYYRSMMHETMMLLHAALSIRLALSEGASPSHKVEIFANARTFLQHSTLLG